MQDCPSERQGSWLKAGQADWDRLIIQRQITRLPCQQVRNSSGRPMSNWKQVVGYYSFLYTAWETTPGIMEAWPNSKMSHTAQLWSQYQAKAIQRLDSLNLNRGVGVWYLWLCGGSVLQIVYFQPIISTACCSKVAKILPVLLDLQIELASLHPMRGYVYTNAVEQHATLHVKSSTTAVQQGLREIVLPLIPLCCFRAPYQQLLR